MKKILIVSTISILFFSILFIAGEYYYNDQKKAGSISNTIKNLIPQEIKKLIKKTVFIIPTLKREVKSLTKAKDFWRYKSKNLESKYYLTLKNEEDNRQSKGIETITLKNILDKKILINNKKLNIKYFQVSSLTNPKHSNATSTGYLSDYEDKIILSTGDGEFYYFFKNDLTNREFKAKKIETNFKSLMQYPEFNQKGMYGIKDLLIKDNKLFATSSSENEKGCFNTAMYNAEINFSNLVILSACINLFLSLFLFNIRAILSEIEPSIITVS